MAKLPKKPKGHKPVVRRASKGQRKREGVIRTRRIKGKLVTKAKRRKKRARVGTARPNTDQTGLVSPVEKAEGYVRFRMRVDNGRMSIVGSHYVDSTLMTTPALGGNFAYEVSDGKKRLHVDSIPDLGVTRSFALPNGPLELRRHHITRLSTYEFDVRVPAPTLRRASLQNIQITLYRVEKQPPKTVLGAAPLHTQFERELREVASVQGIPPAALPREMRKT
jgi:hypothetical protein